MRSWVAGGRRLDSNPVLSALATSLDDQGVYGAVLVPDRRDAVADVRDGPPLLDPFDAMAVGFVKIAGEPVNVFSYYFADAAIAARNVSTLETLVRDGHSSVSSQPLADKFAVLHVSAVGHVLTANLAVSDVTSADIGWPMIRTQDVLTMHSASVAVGPTPG